MNNRMCITRCLIGSALTLMVALPTFAQKTPPPPTKFPSQPIHLVVPFNPGGSTDALARILAAGMSDRLGEQVVVENRPGAGGNIAMGHVARAAPDGHTLLIASSSLVVNPSLYKSIPYDPLKSFAPISYLASAPSLLIVHPSVKARNVAELATAIKENPGKYDFSSPGAGTAQHLAGELFGQETQGGIVHVPFNGAGPSVTAVMSNVTPLGFASLPSALPQVNSGMLRALAITSKTRSPAAPDIPTFAEQGYDRVESDHLQGLLAPAGTPPSIVKKLSTVAREVLTDPPTAKKLNQLGFIIVADTPKEFQDEIGVQVKKWSTLVKHAGLTVAN